MLTLTVNGTEQLIDGVEPSTPLLWVLRDNLNLVGAKYGCGVGQCGACTVWIDGAPVRSCSFSAVAAAEHAVTTIEGLSQVPIRRCIRCSRRGSISTCRNAATVRRGRSCRLPRC